MDNQPLIDYKPTQEDMRKVWDIFQYFIIKNNIIAPESIEQNERVIENSYDLIRDVCEIIGYAPDEDWENWCKGEE